MEINPKSKNRVCPGLLYLQELTTTAHNLSLARKRDVLLSYWNKDCYLPMLLYWQSTYVFDTEFQLPKKQFKEQMCPPSKTLLRFTQPFVWGKWTTIHKSPWLLRQKQPCTQDHQAGIARQLPRLCLSWSQLQCSTCTSKGPSKADHPLINNSK